MNSHLITGSLDLNGNLYFILFSDSSVISQVIIPPWNAGKQGLLGLYNKEQPMPYSHKYIPEIAFNNISTTYY